MSERRVTRGLSSLVLAVLASGVGAAQSGFPAAAPNNPFDPPPCTGTFFDDVNCGGLFDAWIELFYLDGITGGCGGGNYCPNNPVTRGQMAVFVEKAMRGTAGWAPGSMDHGNTGLGAGALFSNSVAWGNTAVGLGALGLQSFDNGGTEYETQNTAIGSYALFANQPTSGADGRLNTALGSGALTTNETGSENTAVGMESLWKSNGFRNTGVGYRAGGREDTITGYLGTSVTLVPNETGNYNTFLGITGATTQVNNCTAVGIDAYCTANDQVRLGNVFVNSIGGKVDWSTLSDARAKEDVRELDQGLPLVLALKPVSYRYRAGNGRADMGFVAQDVEELLGDSYNVVDAGGDADRTLSLRYSQLIAPLVKAVQEQQAQIEALRAEVTALRERDGAKPD